METSRTPSKSSNRKLILSESDDSNEDEEDYQKRAKGKNKQRDDAIKGIKLKILMFQEKSDPETYLAWE